MMNFSRTWPIAWVGGLLLAGPVLADNVRIEHVDLHRVVDQYTVQVTLRHKDTGWDHYADAWRVVDSDGTELGKRTLYHPHVDEQPFTRSLSALVLPEELTEVFIEAHDKVHGWSPDRVRVALDKPEGDRYQIRVD